jgi:hypothetical protein
LPSHGSPEKLPSFLTTFELRNIELIIVGQMSSFYKSIPFLLPFGDMDEPCLKGSKDLSVQILQLIHRFAPKFLAIVGLKGHSVLYPQHSKKIEDRQQKDQSIGKGLLIGITEKPDSGLHINRRPLLRGDMDLLGVLNRLLG